MTEKETGIEKEKVSKFGHVVSIRIKPGFDRATATPVLEEAPYVVVGSDRTPADEEGYYVAEIISDEEDAEKLNPPGFMTVDFVEPMDTEPWSLERIYRGLTHPEGHFTDPQMQRLVREQLESEANSE